MPVLDAALPGAPLFSHGIGCPGLPLLVLEFLHPDSTLFVKQLARFGRAISIAGPPRIGSCLAVRSYVTLGPPLSVFATSRFGLFASVTDLVTSGMALVLQGASRIGFISTVLGCAQR